MILPFTQGAINTKKNANEDSKTCFKYTSMEIINQTYHSTIRPYKKLHKYISSMADSDVSGTGTIMEQQRIEIFRFKASAHTCVGHSPSALP